MIWLNWRSLCTTMPKQRNSRNVMVGGEGYIQTVSPATLISIRSDFNTEFCQYYLETPTCNFCVQIHSPGQAG